MIINDIEIKSLRQQQAILNRQEYRSEITSEEFEEKIKPVEEKIRICNERIIKDIQLKQKERFAEIDKNKEEVKTERKKYTVKLGRKSKEGSFATAIEKVLKMPEIKSLDEAVKKANEIKPGRSYEKTETQMKTIIRLVKSGGQARWKLFNWNEEEFLLTPK